MKTPKLTNSGASKVYKLKTSFFEVNLYVLSFLELKQSYGLIY